MLRAAAIAAMLLLLAGCRSSQPLPALPDVSTGSFLPEIRKGVEAALADARTHPRDAAANGRLGMILQAHRQLAGARACYLRASMLDPKNFEWEYYLGLVSDGAEAVEPLRAALRLRNYLPARLKLADALLASGDSAGARDVVRGIEHPAALFDYGRAANDPAYYEKALALFPQYGAAIFALAQHYQRTGRVADAQRLMAEYPRYQTTAPPVDDPLLEAVRSLNRGPDRLLGEAASLESEGKLSAAVDLQLQALQLDPKLTQAHINLISLYGRLSEAGKAEQHYREAIALNPNAHEAYYNFGVLCYESHRRAEARAAFEKALAIDPGYAEAHNNLGALFEEEGNLAGAAVHFRKAIQTRPSFALAHFHLGRIYVNQNRYPDAIAEFQRAVEGASVESAPTYLYALGAAQARSGSPESARKNLATAREKAQSLGQSALAASIDRDLARLKP
jgi:tetratricopeptide (TPR) repeat protein